MKKPYLIFLLCVLAGVACKKNDNPTPTPPVVPFPPLTTITAVQSKLDSATAGLRPMYQNLAVIDGVMSDDADCSGNSSYCAFDNFTVTPSAIAIDTIWRNAYFQNIPLLNYALRDLPSLNIDADQKKDLIAQAKGLRGYIYLEILTYFGGAPLQDSLKASLGAGVTRLTPDNLYDSIVADLTAAAADLPVTRTSGKGSLTKYAAIGLLAKAALYKKDYATLATYTSQIINNGGYTLATLHSWLTDPATTETIWAPAFSQIGSTASWYYTATAFPDVTVQYCPVLRYGQILLMDVEAQVALANYPSALLTINTIRARNNMTPAFFTDAASAFTVFAATWQQENYRQGDRFSNLVRWGVAATALGPNGFHLGVSNLLPVPQAILNSNAGLNQNPGY